MPGGETRIPGGRRGAAAAVLALAVLSACDGDVGVRIRLVVDSELSPPSDFDAVVVTAAASGTEEGRICEPVERTFPVESGRSLPIVVYFLPGAELRAWVAFRVEWRKNGVTVHRREVVRPIPDGGGIFEVRLLYEEACRDADCGPDGQCVAGVCEDLLLPGPFDDPSIVDPDLSCGE